MVGVQVRPCRAPSLDSADPFEPHGRAWHPDIVSELACVHLSIFEHAKIDRRTEQSVRCVGAVAPSTCGAWMRLIFRVTSIVGLCSNLSHRRSRIRARFFARPFGSEMGAGENTLRRLFFPCG
jgi:hypothetical protein